MDVLYHGLTGFLIAKYTGSPYVSLAALSAMIPDLVGATPYYYFKFKKEPPHSIIAFIKSTWKFSRLNIFDNTTDQSIYHMTHSFITCGIITALSYIFLRSAWVVIGLSYLSHILIDIPTHEGDFATRIFYPFSDIHVESKNWANDLRRSLLFWGVLFVALLFLSITQRVHL